MDDETSLAVEDEEDGPLLGGFEVWEVRVTNMNRSLTHAQQVVIDVPMNATGRESVHSIEHAAASVFSVLSRTCKDRDETHLLARAYTQWLRDQAPRNGRVETPAEV